MRILSLGRLFALAVTGALLPAALPAGFMVGDVSTEVVGDATRLDYGVAIDNTPITPNGKSYFTIYDFAGYLSGLGVTSPDGWEFTSALVGPTPDLVTPPDAPTLYNLTWTYTGQEALRNLIVTGFSAFSSLTGSAEGYVTTTDQRTSTIGRVSVPSGSPGNPDPIDFANPEPASLALMGVGGLGLALYAGRRRRRD